MLLRQRQLYAKFQKLFDAAAFGVAWWLAHTLRSLPGVLRADLIEPFGNYLWLLLIIVPLTPFVLELQGFYLRPLLYSRRQTFWQLAKGAFWVSLTVIATLYFRKWEGARGVLLLFGPLAIALVFLKEEIVRAWAISHLGRRASRKRVILIGSRDDTKEVERALTIGALGEVEIIARVNLHETPARQLPELLHETSANAVLIAPHQVVFGEIEQAIQACELEGVEVWLLADFFQTRLSETSVDELAGHPVLVFRTGPEVSWQAIVKSGVDFIGSLVLLGFMALPMLVLALLVKLTSPGPVLFRQERAGLNGRPFTMLKFRTMVSNAEQLKLELAQLNEMTGPVFKISNDPRITPLGRTLRKYSLDELPQLFNVFRGEMSLVGPRPLPVDEVRRFDDPADRRRLSVRPGLTCLWQVSGRNEVTDFKEWVRLDLEYIDNWSLWLDLKILLRTIPAVFAGTGAR
ncbi:MAG TPA: sugar transferase [Verrucomicrobiota bacterium]|nr:exopolysaccharide biosynthesis polyprenyl glycosylphosphotransferase [Verrucomicrobiales bacterium]HRI16253.1 sugar transferase [Verrucomicrobiota bacterium]